MGGKNDGREEAGDDRKKRGWVTTRGVEKISVDHRGLTFREAAFLQFGQEVPRQNQGRANGISCSFLVLKDQTLLK